MPDLNLGHTRLIRDAATSAGLSVQQTAYVLATAYWEAARTMLPVEEAYYLGPRAEAYRKGLRYYPSHGRGFAQLTWQDNYHRAGQILGVDLIADPSRAMDPEISAQKRSPGSFPDPRRSSMNSDTTHSRSPAASWVVGKTVPRTAF